MIKNLKLSLNDIIFQSPDLVASNMDGETVMLSILNGKYYNLGEMGGVIWSQLVNPIQIKDVVNSLITDYDVNPNECEDQVLTFLESLLNEGIIRIEE